MPDVLKYKDLVSKIVRLSGVRADDREDAEQECYLRLLEQGDCGQGKAERICRAVCSELLTPFKPVSESEIAAPELSIQPDKDTWPSDAVGLLPPKERLIIERRFKHGQNLEDCAAHLSLPVSEVRKIEGLALQKLKVLLSSRIDKKG